MVMCGRLLSYVNRVLRLSYMIPALSATVMVDVACGLLRGLNIGTLFSILLHVRTSNNRICSLDDRWTSPMCLCLSRHT